MTRETSKRSSRKQRRTASGGSSYVVVSYIFVGLFLAMIAYMIYFQTNKSEDLLNSPYNKRSEKKAVQVVRGSILASDGTILANTTTDEEGNEIRNYPYNNLFAQVVGYSDYGSAGLEATQNNAMLTSHEDIINQVEKELNAQKKNGDDLVTSLDVGLQQRAYDALAGRRGAAVVLDANTAKVKACVSLPDFNPNTVSEDWETLNLDDSGSPFINRAIQGLYEPGSTFKVVTALAYLEQYGSDAGFSFNCTGEYTQGGYTIHCSNGAVHGEESLQDAFANSCNCAFSYIATELLDPKALAKAAGEFKFNTDFSFGLPSATSRFSLDKTTTDGLSMQTAIGQGDTLVTPMHMAMIAQAVYNNGEMTEPSFIQQIQSHDGNIVSTEEPKSLGTVMDPSIAAQLKSYMQAVVQYGTASSLAELPYNVAGKTGTAEYDNSEGYVHSWFIGFTQTGNSDIVVAVVLEQAVPGQDSAASVAADIISGYYQG